MSKPKPPPLPGERPTSHRASKPTSHRASEKGNQATKIPGLGKKK